MSEAPIPSPRTRVVGEPERGVYDRATAYEILDEGFICHVGLRRGGTAICDSHFLWRVRETRFIFMESAASRMLKRTDEGIPEFDDTVQLCWIPVFGTILLGSIR